VEIGKQFEYARKTLKEGSESKLYSCRKRVFVQFSPRFIAQTQNLMSSPKNSAKAYWSANLKLVGCLLIVWFTVSFGCGILLKEQLDQFSIGGAPLGFWMAQQGSIICFVFLLIAYAFFMNKLDKEHGYDEGEED
jgi:putative solute:sodium symporter small subunit